MAGVFISSTGKDLADYRAAAIEICNRLRLVPIAMEYFEAMGQGATQGSKHQMDEADVYVGIFGYRYGYIEEGYDLAVTEIEFDYAGTRGIDRLNFLVSADYPWPPDLIEYGKQDQLNLFKDKINKLIRNEFTTVEDFKVKLMQSLAAWKAQHSESSSTPQDERAKEAPAFTAPPRPTLVIGREDDTAAIKARLGVGDGKKPALTIIRGWPGVGKTTLVTSIAYDQAIKERFPDGILWAALGEQAQPAFELAAWGRQLGIPELEQANSLESAISQVRAALLSKRMLLIVDDTWEADHAIPFMQLPGPDCGLIITTRFPDVAHRLATSIADDVYLLGVLNDDQALELLGRLTSSVVKDYPDHARRLVQDIEGLPLAIRVAGRLLANEAAMGMDVRPLMDEIRESHKLLDEIAPDDRFDPATGKTPTIDYLLRRSTERLDEETRERFAMLGAFAPKPATFDREAMAFVWDVADPMLTARKLVDRGLLEPIISLGRFQMHALLVKHAETLLDAED